jgi:hypothetical protein
VSGCLVLVCLRLLRLGRCLQAEQAKNDCESCRQLASHHLVKGGGLAHGRVYECKQNIHIHQLVAQRSLTL